MSDIDLTPAQRQNPARAAAESASRWVTPGSIKGVGGEGTGLGLDIAQKIVVRRHGGSIPVSSESGETHFMVRLPLNP